MLGLMLKGHQLGITGTGTGRKALEVFGGEAVKVEKRPNTPGPLIVQGAG